MRAGCGGSFVCSFGEWPGATQGAVEMYIKRILVKTATRVGDICPERKEILERARDGILKGSELKV
jgi:hypothetical protein